MDRWMMLTAAAFAAGLVPFFLWRSVVHARLGLEPELGPSAGHREETAYRAVRERAFWLTAFGWMVWPGVAAYLAAVAYGRWWVRREITKPAAKPDAETYRG